MTKNPFIVYMTGIDIYGQFQNLKFQELMLILASKSFNSKQNMNKKKSQRYKHFKETEKLILAMHCIVM